MFAIISSKAEWGWDALPQSYRESLYLHPDDDAILSYYGDTLDDEGHMQVALETGDAEISTGSSQCTTTLIDIPTSQVSSLYSLLHSDKLKSTWYTCYIHCKNSF